MCKVNTIISQSETTAPKCNLQKWFLESGNAAFVCCQRSLWWKFVQNFTHVLVAMGQFALDHIQRQHRRCKRIRQYLPFVVKLTFGGNIVRLSCHEMVMIIYSTGDDDSMICQWVTFQGCFEHQDLRLANKSDQDLIRFDYNWQHLILFNQSDLIWRRMDDTERGCTLSFTSYWTGSVPPGRSSCSAAWREREGEMKRGEREDRNRNVWKGDEEVWTLNTWTV